MLTFRCAHVVSKAVSYTAGLRGIRGIHNEVISPRVGYPVCSKSVNGSQEVSGDHRRISMESVNLKSSPNDIFASRARLGHHLVIDLFGCNPEKIKKIASVENILLEAAKAAKATVVAQKFHQFNPDGVSGALVLAESHLAIHTWPEVDGYCAIDIFTCGDTNNFAALEIMKSQFEATGCVLVEIDRGMQRDAVPALTAPTPSADTFIEGLDPLKGFKTTLKTKALLEQVDSEFQSIKMFDTESVGKMLTIDGIIQLSEYDNAAYHEMITHVPMQSHPNPRRVLVIGGGDGGALAELVKYSSVEEIVICDIDPMVAEVSGRYFPAFAEAYKDPRVRSLYQDGAKLVNAFNNYFDVIIVDCTDFYGVAAPFARKEFYESIHTALTDDGITVIQAESMYFDRAFIAGLHKQVSSLFSNTNFYHALVPTYPSGTIGFVLGSKKHDPTEIVGKNPSVYNNLEYYNSQIHCSSFSTPNFLKRLLQ